MHHQQQATYPQEQRYPPSYAQVASSPGQQRQHRLQSPFQQERLIPASCRPPSSGPLQSTSTQPYSGQRRWERNASMTTQMRGNVAQPSPTHRTGQAQRSQWQYQQQAQLPVTPNHYQHQFPGLSSSDDMQPGTFAPRRPASDLTPPGTNAGSYSQQQHGSERPLAPRPPETPSRLRSYRDVVQYGRNEAPVNTTNWMFGVYTPGDGSRNAAGTLLTPPSTIKAPQTPSGPRSTHSSRSHICDREMCGKCFDTPSGLR